MKTERSLLCSVKVEEICEVFFLGLTVNAVRDFFTEELVEERKGREKIFDEIRKKQVDEKKDEKKNWNEKKTKKREEGLVGIFFFFNYNYSSSQQIKNKIYHNSCGVNVKRKLNLLIKY